MFFVLKGDLRIFLSKIPIHTYVVIDLNDPTIESDFMSEETIVPKLLTVKEVSHLLRIHRPKVYELIKRGDITGFKLGADWRIKRDSIEVFVGEITNEMLKAASKGK